MARRDPAGRNRSEVQGLVTEGLMWKAPTGPTMSAVVGVDIVIALCTVIGTILSILNFRRDGMRLAHETSSPSGQDRAERQAARGAEPQATRDGEPPTTRGAEPQSTRGAEPPTTRAAVAWWRSGRFWRTTIIQILALLLVASVVYVLETYPALGSAGYAKQGDCIDQAGKLIDCKQTGPHFYVEKVVLDTNTNNVNGAFVVSPQLYVDDCDVLYVMSDYIGPTWRWTPRDAILCLQRLSF
jgi:hypothetical protein